MRQCIYHRSTPEQRHRERCSTICRSFSLVSNFLRGIWWQDCGMSIKFELRLDLVGLEHRTHHLILYQYHVSKYLVDSIKSVYASMVPNASFYPSELSLASQ